MDADFLKRTVGGPLSQSLTAMVIAQPEDPVEYLGKALLDHVRRVEESERKESYAALLQAKLEEHRKVEAVAAKVSRCTSTFAGDDSCSPP